MGHFNRRIVGWMAKNGSAALTIDQLAHRTGMTVRNIRAHQSRGLLSPPEVKGRTGYYGPDHVERITLIRDLQADGYSLDLIGRILARAGEESPDALRFTRALREPWTDEAPQVVDEIELASRYGTTDPELLGKAEELGLVRPLGGGKWEELSPRLGRAGAELTNLGIPAKEALRVVARVRRNADSAARTFVHLFVEEVWKPFQREGSPDEQWPDIRDALERLRPLASDSMLALLQMAMEAEVEEAFGRELKRARREARRRR
jgi:DNA-binding transcriptional MerR regulator